MVKSGFNLVNESAEVLQFAGFGYIGLLIARRPISQNILKDSLEGGSEGIRFVRGENLIG